jgi:hypothetical protein
MSVYSLVDILIDEFWKNVDKDSEDDTEEAYAKFVQEFAKANNMKIYGKLNGTSWNTKGFKFDKPEDEVFFKLKYS